MAVSNAIGSNVFDILLCLGLPWFLKTTIQQSYIEVYSGGRLFQWYSVLKSFCDLKGNLQSDFKL